LFVGTMPKEVCALKDTFDLSCRRRLRQGGRWNGRMRLLRGLLPVKMKGRYFWLVCRVL
jgi:hypothetical protein